MTKRLQLLLLYFCFVGFAYAQSNITELEYFFNTDPGFGNGTPVTITTGGTLETQINITSDSWNEGLNYLYVRVKDNNGDWSLYDYKSFYVSPIDSSNNRIVAAEYFVGEKDPGFGKATSLALTSGNQPDEFIFYIPTDSLTCGKNNFYIRVKDSNGIWSLYDDTLNIDIIDSTPPVIKIKDKITLFLNGKDSVILIPDSIDLGTTDDCGFVLSLSQNTFSKEGIYAVTVTATDPSGKTATAVCEVTVKGTLGIDYTELSKMVSLHPNPVSNILIITTELEIQRASLHDISGKTLGTFNMQGSRKIDMSQMEPGIYLVKILCSDAILTKRIIRQ